MISYFHYLILGVKVPETALSDALKDRFDQDDMYEPDEHGFQIVDPGMSGTHYIAGKVLACWDSNTPQDTAKPVPLQDFPEPTTIVAALQALGVNGITPDQVALYPFTHSF